MRRIFRCAARALAVPLLWYAQTAAALSLLDVIEMSRGGYSESEMVRLIEVTGARFEIDGVGLVALKEAEVPDGLIDRMLDEGGIPPSEVSEITAKAILELHEAGLSEETLLKFVRHRNVCTPLSEDGVHLLEREAFSSEFLEGFLELVAACEKDRVAREPVEPLPEDAYAGSASEAPHGASHSTSHSTYQTTYHYDQHYYERPHHDHYFNGHYHPSYVYSYYHYDPVRRVYPIYIFRDHRDRRDRKARRGRGRDRDRDRPERRADAPAPRGPGPAVPGGRSRLFDEPRPVMTAHPGRGGGGSQPARPPGRRPVSEPVVPGGPLLRGPRLANPGVDRKPEAPRLTPAVVENAKPDARRPGTRAVLPANAGLPSVPGGPLRGLPERPRSAPTPSPVVPRAAQQPRAPSATPARRAAVPTRAIGRVPASPSVPPAVRQVTPVRPRVAAPDRVTPRAPARPPATRPVTPRAPTPAAPSRRFSVPGAGSPRPAAPVSRPARAATPRAVAPRPAVRRAAPPRAASRPAPTPRNTRPRAVAPRSPLSRPASPRAVVPRAVAPRTPAPRAAAPRAAAPRAPAPRANPRAVAPPRATAPRARATPRQAPRAPRQASRQVPRSGPPSERRAVR